MIRISTLTSSTGEPVDLEDAKIHMRLEPGQNPQEDDLIVGWIQTARETFEDITGMRLMPRTCYVYFDDFPAGEFLNLPVSPVRSIPSSGVYYTNSSGGSTTLSSSKWDADTVSIPGRLVLNSNYEWPSDTLANLNPLRIEANVGFAGSSAIPASAKSAIKLMIGHWYENREETIVGVQDIRTLPMGAVSIMNRYKTFYTRG